mgnify:CR=1 FL=1
MGVVGAWHVDRQCMDTADLVPWSLKWYSRTTWADAGFQHTPRVISHSGTTGAAEVDRSSVIH